MRHDVLCDMECEMWGLHEAQCCKGSQADRDCFFYWPSHCIIDAHYDRHCHPQTLHRHGHCQVNVSPTSADAPWMPLYNLVSACVINEPNWHFTQGFYDQMRRFCFIKTQWCANTFLVGVKSLIWQLHLLSPFTILNLCLSFIFACWLVAFPQRAVLILCYWLSRSRFAPSHKPSL